MGSTRSVQWMGDTAYRKSGCNIINGHAKDELEIEKQKKKKHKRQIMISLLIGGVGGSCGLSVPCTDGLCNLGAIQILGFRVREELIRTLNRSLITG